MSGGGAAVAGNEAGDGCASGSGSERRVHIMVEYCEPCGFGATYEELASAVREEYPDIEIESRLGGTAIRRARNGEPLEKITNSRPPCVIL
ncbi:hypothetical protein ASZ78_008976 [Callipepla squamata]|uniref:Migration and invasion enhancer 1 n=1 Tax=Callipepla squamata TaxID=9009 RepID=A0A226N815_CALSU|nr:hypothetical protein ASZ78_008976 [Callipepla squamata]